MSGASLLGPVFRPMVPRYESRTLCCKYHTVVESGEQFLHISPDALGLLSALTKRTQGPQAFSVPQQGERSELDSTEGAHA